MSVLKNKRKVSDMEFIHNAYKIRAYYTKLLLRDFGVRDKIRTPETFAKQYKMTDEDKIALQELIKKYKIRNISEEFPGWLIDEFRRRFMSEIRFMIRNIIQANSIYPTSLVEYHKRREYQTKAIGCCEQLLQEMQYVITIINVDINKFLPYVDMVEKEIALLKGWRKSDNRMVPGLLKKEAQLELDKQIEYEKLEYYDVNGDTEPPRKAKKIHGNQNRNTHNKSNSTTEATSPNVQTPTSTTEETQEPEKKKKFEKGKYDKDLNSAFVNEYLSQLEEVKQIEYEVEDTGDIDSQY